VPRAHAKLKPRTNAQHGSVRVLRRQSAGGLCAGALPLGKIVRALPAGCAETTIGSVAYQKCGADYYRVAFQGSQLVYVTTQP
jgi:hypothetical protein